MKRLSFGTVLLAVVLAGTIISCKKEENPLPKMPSYEKTGEEPARGHVTVEPGQNEAYIDSILSETLSILDLDRIADCIGPVKAINGEIEGGTDFTILGERIENAFSPVEEVNGELVPKENPGPVAVLDVLSGDYVVEEIQSEPGEKEEELGEKEEELGPKKLEQARRLVRKGDLPGAIRITMQDQTQRTVCAVVKFSGVLSETVVNESISLSLPTHLELFLLHDGVQRLAVQLDLEDVPESKSVVVKKHVKASGRAIAGGTLLEIASADIDFFFEQYRNRWGNKEVAPTLIDIKNLDLALYGRGLYAAGIKGDVTITSEVKETVKGEDGEIVGEKRQTFISTDLTADFRHKLLGTVVLNRMYSQDWSSEEMKDLDAVVAHVAKINGMLDIKLYYGSEIQEVYDAYMRVDVLDRDEYGYYDTGVAIIYSTDSNELNFLNGDYLNIDNFPRTYEQVAPIPVLFQLLFAHVG